MSDQSIASLDTRVTFIEQKLGITSALPTLSINNVTKAEGNTNGDFVFTVTRSGNLNVVSSVLYSTVDGTGNKTDYVPVNGVLTFVAGEAIKTISVTVIGDVYVETDNTFTVQLSSPSNATIAVGAGKGTILNDDAAVVTPTPTPTPTPVPEPTPVPATVVNKPAPTPSGVLLATGTQKVTSVFDGKNATYKANDKNTQFNVWGGKLTNLTISTLPRSGETVTLNGSGTGLENVSFSDNGGNLVMVYAANTTIKNLWAKSFTGYATFANDGAKNILIDGFYVVGGSVDESILRFEGATGELRNFYIDYTTTKRKACIRGQFSGTIRDGFVRGAIVGLNPLDNDDGGQTMGFWKFVANVPGGMASAANVQACIDAVRAAEKKGVTSQIELVRAAYAVARDGNGKTFPADLDATAKGRVAALARRSNVKFINVSVNASMRWSAGCVHEWTDCTINSDTLFDSPKMSYPDAQYVMKGDTVRPAPVVTFTRCKFTSSKTLADFKALCSKYNVSLTNCTFNGAKV